MSLYRALNYGDASISERHLTSILYYLFNSDEVQTKESFLSEFIKKYIPSIKEEYSIESIKIEEILKDEKANRKDCDITISLKLGSSDCTTIINLENKISNGSFRKNQISEQDELLRRKYPGSNILNFYILPYKSNKIELSENANIIYWLADVDGLLSLLNGFSKINQLDDFVNFLNDFGFTLEQKMLSENEEKIRNSRNPYPKSMYEYLKEIADNWMFTSRDNVNIQMLLDKFLKVVGDDLESNGYGASEINQFKSGAWEAQPKIMTINELNRNNFGGIKDPCEKALFFYPDYPNGDYRGKVKWKQLRILPISEVYKYKDVVVFWKNKQDDRLESTIYNCN